MDNEVKQRNRRRKRAQRMQAQRANKAKEGDSGEDESPDREKPVRPPNRRKKSKEPLVEEDIIDGFAILGFRTYEDLENVIALAAGGGKPVTKTREKDSVVKGVVEEKPKLDTGQRAGHCTPLTAHHITSNHHPPTHGLLLTHADAGTSDDSGRASERLTGSSVAPRDPDSSRDRLSDASSRCSSGKGYICDSEGEDDKGSDAGSVLFASTPTPQRKHEFPGSGLPPSVPGGGSASPVPAPTSPCLAPPAPSPAPAALPPHSALPSQPPYSSPLPNHVISAELPPAPVKSSAPTSIASMLVNHTTNIVGIQPPHSLSSQSLPPNHAVTNLTNSTNHVSALGQVVPPSSNHITNLPPNHIQSNLMISSNGHANSNRATTLSSHQIPSSLSASQSTMTPSNHTHAGHASINHVSGTSAPNNHNVLTNSGSAVTVPTAVNSIPNHVLPNQPNHCLSNHPVSSISTSRVPSPPPPLSAATPPASLPAALPQPATAPTTLPPRETSIPAVVTSTSSSFITNGIGGYQQTTAFPSYPPLYAPYAASMRNSVPVPSPNQLHRTAAPNMSSPTTTQTPAIVPTSSVPVISVPQIPVASAITSSHRESITTTLSSTRGTHSPRGHSPTRERDSYSSNVSSLSRGSVTPVSLPYSSASASSNLSSSLAFSKAAAWNSSPAGVVPSSIGPSSSQLSPAPPRPTPPPPTVAPPSMHSFPTPMFPPPLAPPPVSAPSPLSLQPNTNPFSADTLFQSNQADMLRRELDNRFLASQDRSLAVVAAPSYIRTEMHQHQHHHTHVHQHAAPILPPPPAPSAVVPPPSLFPPPLFKEIPKMGSVDSPFYRQNLGLSSYPSYSAGLLHPGLGGPTPFVPPNHLPAFQPKKSGKWNAMHVRVAWEIYHHQQKQQSDLKPGAAKVDLLRPPTHMFPGGLVHPSRPHELPFHRGPPFDTSPHPGSLFAAPPTQFAPGINPFGRYGSTFPNPGSPFGISPFPPPSRDIATLGSLHDPWSRSVSALQRTVASYPPAPGHWALKPDPVVLERREQEERERERIRRERERERERERKQQLEQQERERERERDRREKERREMERRELERLHQQRLAESKVVTASRERSPLRNGTTEDVRVKEEPRPKDEDLLSRTDPRYNPYLRHPPNSLIPPPRGVMPAGLAAPSLPAHFPPPPGSGWPPPGSDPFRDPYRFEPLRYNPLMEAAMRVEEERVKMFGSYASQHHLRPAAKDPASMLHLRPTVGSGPPPPQTKEDSSQSR